MLKHLIEKSGDAGAHAALVNALQRPIPYHTDITTDYVANWLREGLWLEGYQLTPVPRENDDDG